MRNLWVPSQHRIGGIRAIELTMICLDHTNVEYCLASRRGEIWEVSEGRYQAVILTSPSGYMLDNEQLVRFGEDELQKYIEMLRIPEDPRDQTPFANKFGKIV